MKKLLFAAAILFCCLPAMAEVDEATQKKCWKVFEVDHKDYKDGISTIRIWKKTEKIFETYYEEKNKFTPSADDNARGFSLFTKSTGEDLFPNSLPAKEDVVKEFTASGVREEFEPIVICVLPKNDLSNVSISVSDLSKENGKKIPKESIVVKHVKYEYLRVGNAWMCKGRYMVKGPTDIPAGVTRAFWLTVKVPANAEPGVYKGKAMLMAGARPTEIPVSFEVIPFDWAEFSPEHTFWLWDYNGYLENAVLEKRLENLRDHGMNCFDSGVPATWKIEGGEMKIDFSTADRVAPLLKKYGYKKWMFDNMIYGEVAKKSGAAIWSAEHKRLYKSMVVQFKERADKNGWPEVIWTVDEPRENEDSGGPGIRKYDDILNWSKLMAETGAHYNVSWAGDGPKSRYVELVQYLYYSTTHAPVASCEKLIKKANELKKPQFLYNCGANRYAFGALTKQQGSIGNSQFWYCAATYLNPGGHMFWWSMACTDKAGNIIDTYEYDQIREGIDDYKYIWTLEKALEKYGKNDAKSTAAKNVLNEITNIKFKMNDSTDIYDASFMDEGMTYFKGSQLDKMRKKLVKATIDLK